WVPDKALILQGIFVTAAVQGLVRDRRRALDAVTIRESSMAIDGNWEITINSPMGAQKAKLEMAAKDGALTGTQQAQGSTQPLNGKADGNAVSWSASITSPMPMTLEFSGTVEGDTIK